MRYWILCIGLMLSLSACRLSFGGAQDQATPTTQSSITQPAVTVTQRVPVTSTPTVRPTNTPPKVNTSVPQPNCIKQTSWPTYTVVSGDTLGKIAQRTSSDTGTLTTANCLSDANQISVGQVLYVPRQPVTIPPTAVPVTAAPQNDFVLSSLPTNPGCYLQVYGMMGNANVYGVPTEPVSSPIMTISSTLFYRIYTQTTIYYEIAYNVQGHKGWVEKTAGAPVGNCGVLTQAASYMVTTRNYGIAIDHLSNWFTSFNIDGLPGGTVGTTRLSEVPSILSGWLSDMVLIGYTIVPDGMIGPSLEIGAREAVENLRQSGRYTIVREVTPFTTGNGYSGFVYDYSDTSSNYRTYYLRVGDKNVVFLIQGNFALGDAVVSTVRPA